MSESNPWGPPSAPEPEPAPLLHRGVLVYGGSDRLAPEREEQFADLCGGTRLPEELREFLSVTERWGLPYSVFLAGRPYGFTLLSSREILSVSAQLGDVWFRDRLPRDFLAVGQTGGEDDVFLVDMTPAGHGRVLAWISAREGWPGKPQRDLLHEVAPSWDAFLARLLVLEQDLDEGLEAAQEAWLASATRVPDYRSGGRSWGPAFQHQPSPER